MTRRQAIQKILAYLKQQPDLTQELHTATLLLEEFLNALPGKIWDDRSIRQAIEKHIAVFHHPPSTKDLDIYPYLPRHPVIKNYYKMSAGKWLRENYPMENYGKVPRCQYYGKRYPDKGVLIEVFKQEYARIQPRSCLQYNKQRTPGTPAWQFIAKVEGLKTWVELKERCGLPKAPPRRGELDFILDSHRTTPPDKTPLEKKEKPTAPSEKKKKNLSPPKEEQGYISIKRHLSIK